jgi:hypothetical protein
VPTTSKNKMGHITIHHKIKKENHNIIQGHPNQYSIQFGEHNTKQWNTHRLIEQKQNLPKEMFRLPAEIFRKNGQSFLHQIQTIQDTQTIYYTQDVDVEP